MIVRLILPEWAKDKNLPNVIEKDMDMEEILKYNKQGYNCYYLPNFPKKFFSTDDCKYVNGTHIDVFSCVFADMDLKDGKYKTKEDFIDTIKNSNIPPTKIVDSGNGIHAYWSVSDLDAKSYLRLQRRIMRRFNTDESTTTIYQLLRIPGTVNTKKKDDLKQCYVVFENPFKKEYSAEELDNLLPKITVDDERFCEDHYNLTYNLTAEEQQEVGEIPLSFQKLMKENNEVKQLFTNPGKDRSSADYRLAHLMQASGMTKSEARAVLYNTAKAITRAPKHRYNYANNIVSKIWTEEKSSLSKMLSRSVRDILSKNPSGNLENTRLPCHPLFDGTKHGFRLTEVLGLVGGSGIGKCLGKDTPILMYDGSIKPVQDVKAGELLMGPDSKPRKVLSLARGKEELFKIIPTKGDPFICNKSHILSLKYISSEKKYKNIQKNDIINVSVEEYLNWPDSKKSLFRGYRTAVSFEQKNVLIDPYLLGTWLGDGHSSGTSITTMNSEILQVWNESASEHGIYLRKGSFSGKARTYFITSTRQRKDQNSLLKKFRFYNLIQNKHIPESYKTNSEQIRLELLAGLIDTDGHLINNCYEITQKNKKLADDIIYLARSLGLAAYLKKSYKKAQTVSKNLYYRITISGDVDKIPVRFKYKKATKRKQVKNVLNFGFKLESLGVGDYYGFTIDGDSLFVLGDFTVTHNTTICLNFFKWFVERNPEYIHVFVALEQPENEIALRWAKIVGDNDVLHDKVMILTNYENDGSYRHFTLDGIKEQILNIEKETNKKVGCVVIDHIGVIKKEKRREERDSLESVCSAMKAFAKETNTFLIMQSQTSRAKAGIGDLELDKDAAYGTTSFEWYCDYLVTIWQPLKRVYDEAPHMTSVAFKYCKIRHKDVRNDSVKEDQVYALRFDIDSENLRPMTDDEYEAYDYWNRQATLLRNKDKKKEPAPIKRLEWVDEEDGKAESNKK